MLGHLVQVRDEYRPARQGAPLLQGLVRRMLALFRRH
jgi:hypothetical protein